MASQILDSLTDLFKTQVLPQASARLGEPEGSVARGFEAAAATIIAALANKGTYTGFKQQIFDLVMRPENDGRILDNPIGAINGAAGAAPGGGVGGQLLSLLFGGQQSGVAEIIGRSCGLRSGSVTTLLGMAAPLVLGLLGRRVREDGLNMSSLWGLVQREASGVLAKLPAGVGSLLGFPAVCSG
jgi:OOP family OmpA-OmpF porin